MILWGDTLKKSKKETPLAAFIDNDNIISGIEEQYDNMRSYNIDKLTEFLRDEGDLKFGKVYFNPSVFDLRKKGLLHKFTMNLLEPVYTDTYKYENGSKSLADPKMVWDIAKVCYEKPEIKKFAIVSGDKDFLPVIRRLHAEGKDGVLMYVDGTEAYDLRKTAEDIGWNTYPVPPYSEF